MGTLNTHTIPGGTSTFALQSNNLSVFAVTTSAQLAGIISDETGTGLLVFGTSPTIITPTIASFVNATHTHANAASGGQLTNSALISGVFVAITGIGTQSQALDMGTNLINNVTDPVSPQDAATRAFVLAQTHEAQTPWLSTIDGAGNILQNTGDVAIGQATPTAGKTVSITIPDDTSGEGVIIQNSDGSIEFRNGTGVANEFQPVIEMTLKGSTRTNQLVGQVPVADDSGTTPVFRFNMRQEDNTPVVTRPLFSVENDATAVLTVLANGNVDSEGNNLINLGEVVINATGKLFLDGVAGIGGNTSIRESSADVITFETGAVDSLEITATSINPAVRIDMSGKNIILDSDGDFKMDLGTDDVVKFSNTTQFVNVVQRRDTLLVNDTVIAKYQGKSDDDSGSERAFTEFRSIMEDSDKTGGLVNGSFVFLAMTNDTLTEYMNFNDASTGEIEVFRTINMRQNIINFKTDDHTITPGATNLVIDLGGNNDDFVVKTNGVTRFVVEGQTLVQMFNDVDVSGSDLAVDATQKIFLSGLASDTSIRESAANVMTFEIGGDDIMTLNSLALDLTTGVDVDILLGSAKRIQWGGSTNRRIQNTSGGFTFEVETGDFFNFEVQNNVILALKSDTLTFADSLDMVFNTTTGTKIGTAITQKLAFWNAIPVVQPAHIVDADGTLADITTKFNTLLAQVATTGLQAAV